MPFTLYHIPFFCSLCKKNYICLFLLFLFFCSNNYLFSENRETIIVGEVFDKQTKMPIENASIYFKKTQIGTTSNPEGFFMLRTQEQHSGQLIVSAIGYKSQQFKIEAGQYGGVQVELEEENTLLQDVFIQPGSNPAIALMAKVRANRAQNNVKNSPDFTLKSTEQTQLYISNIEHKTLQRHIWKSLKSGVIETEDSTLLIPLYAAEKQYQQQGKAKTLTQISSEKTTTSPDDNIRILIDEMGKNIDFYQNTILVFGKSFISPLSNTGNTYYQYYLADSTFTARGKKYIIHFKSKNPRNPTFQGDFSIDSATYALQDIHANIPDKSNVNFLSSLKITQYFTDEPNTPFVLQNERISMLFDFAVSLDSTHYFPTLLAIKNTQTDLPFSHIKTDGILPSETIYAAMDSLNNTRLIKFARWTAQTIFTGYAPAGYIDIGRVVQIISLNPVEQVRLGVPLRTSEKLIKNICFEGYGAYGFRDKAWKYMGQVQYRFPTKKRHQISFNYTDDYIRTEISNFDMLMRENTIARGFMDLTTSILVFDPQYNLSRKREARLWINNDWTDNFETEVNLRVGQMNYGNPTLGFYNLPHFRYNNFSVMGRWSWEERTIDTFFKRTHVYNHLPVVYAGIEAGNFKMPETANYSYYAKFNFMIRQNIPLGIAGEIDYLLQTGYILGNVPYPLLQLMHGNESWAFDRYKFSLMRNMEFAADKYIVLHTHWNMGGILFNQIPGINRLNLREIVSLKAAYGGLRSSHNSILSLPDGMKTFSEPYVEVGVGIGNILRVLNVQSIWRLTERNVSELWQIKFQLQLGL